MGLQAESSSLTCSSTTPQLQKEVHYTAWEVIGTLLFGKRSSNYEREYWSLQLQQRGCREEATPLSAIKVRKINDGSIAELGGGGESLVPDIR